MRSKILKNKSQAESISTTKPITAREARESASEEAFKDKYKPSRKHLYAYNETIFRMAQASNTSREASFHLTRDSFCFIHQVVLPKTYAGFRHVLKAHDLL